MGKAEKPPSFSERISQLALKRQGKNSFQKIDSKDGLEIDRESAKSDLSSGLGLAVHLASDLIAGLAVGGIIGFTVDYCFGCRVIFLIIFIFLGFAAGLVNMWRSLCRAGFSPLESSEH